jgi:NAD(P)-dependent dehydrogenase (short-subunit alcohol dehydrogenase family)
MSDLLKGRVAIITGGGRGIGREHCLELARQGATVVVNDLGVGLHGEPGEETPAQSVVAEIEALGGTAVADGTSVTDWHGVGALVERTVADFGHLDVVVNNAGIVRDRMIVSAGEDDWDPVIAVHLKGTFTVTAHACSYWRQVAKAGWTVSGRVINTTSGTGLLGNAGQAAYGAAKAGIANLTTITAMEMARYNVTANAISPVAYTRMLATTPGLEDYTPDPEWDRLDPGNSSPLVAWLASGAAGWLTGQVFRIDGNRIYRMKPWDIDERSYVAASGGRLDAGEIEHGLQLLYGLVPDGVRGSGR